MNRKFPFINGEYYHLFNRGVDKRDVFLDKNDLNRFVESIIVFNNKNNVESLQLFRRFCRTPTPTAVGVGVLQDFVVEQEMKSTKKEPIVSVLAYCLNPNHFHFFIRQEEENGISKFMQKLQGGYTNYFNKKYDRSGALFQGKFKATLIRTEPYFLKLFGYVNRNNLVHDIPESKKELVLSSFEEYKTGNLKVILEENSQMILEKFGGIKGIEENAKESIEMVRKERGKISLDEEDFDFVEFKGEQSS